MDEHLPTPTGETVDEERTWRDVAENWKKVGKQVADLGDRLSSAFREGWSTDEIDEEESKAVADKLRALGDKLNNAVDAMREEAKEPETKAQAKATVRATKHASSELFSELQETLSEGLEDVNKKIDDIRAKRRQKTKEKSEKE